MDVWFEEFPDRSAGDAAASAAAPTLVPELTPTDTPAALGSDAARETNAGQGTTATLVATPPALPKAISNKEPSAPAASPPPRRRPPRKASGQSTPPQPLIQLAPEPDEEPFSWSRWREWFNRETCASFGVSFTVHLLLLLILGLVTYSAGSEGIGMIMGGMSELPGLDNIDELLTANLTIEMPEEQRENEPDAVEPRVADNPAADFSIPDRWLGQTGSDAPAPDKEAKTGKNAGPGVGDFNLPGPRVAKWAVTKGSFSAWTEPEHPAPGQTYKIVIVVRLPANMTTYKLGDLSGRVVGTDGYRQRISYASDERLPVIDGGVSLFVPVPGAQKLVKDTIQIESRMLKEKQTLTLTFDGKNKPKMMDE